MSDMTLRAQRVTITVCVPETLHHFKEKHGRRRAKSSGERQGLTLVLITSRQAQQSLSTDIKASFTQWWVVIRDQRDPESQRYHPAAWLAAGSAKR